MVVFPGVIPVANPVVEMLAIVGTELAQVT